MSAEWIAIIVSSIISILSIFLTLYLHFRKKAKLIINIETRQYDPEKGLDAEIHPINEIVIEVVNCSIYPTTIKDVKFHYHQNDDQTRQAYDRNGHGACLQIYL